MGRAGLLEHLTPYDSQVVTHLTCDDPDLARTVGAWLERAYTAGQASAATT
jgi:hypothetical protein